jgi:enolase
MSTIRQLRARQILDSRGDPTIEVDVELDSGSVGRASVPSGASTGRFEARELRDGRPPWHGRGVSRAVEHVEGPLASALRGQDAGDREGIDQAMVALDGSSGLSRLGANAILGVSLAAARAAAVDAGEPLWRHLATGEAATLPVPLFNLLNGGRHADDRAGVQELLVVPAGVAGFAAALRLGSETQHALAAILRRRGLPTTVADEGGFAPPLGSPDEGLDLLSDALLAAGYEPGRDAWLAIDCAASELGDAGGYELDGEETRSSDEMIALWADLCARYPIISLEDPLGEEDYDGWRRLGRRLPASVHLLGDDLFATHERVLAEGVQLGLASAVLVKPNQAGTLSRTLHVIELALANGITPVISHRSGDTEDPFIADLAVAVGAPGIKAGAPCRSERVAKYNQLLRIEDALGGRARYAGRRLLREGRTTSHA